MFKTIFSHQRQVTSSLRRLSTVCNSDVRVRFAPSPTGSLHLGGLRTALFNFMFARKSKGSVILRIEDTDQKRSVDGAVDELINMLDWCGVSFDEGPHTENQSVGPFVQSQRLSIYHKYIDELIDRKAAYRCFCSSERLESLRQDAYRRGLPVGYDRKCLSLSEEDVKAKLRDNTPFTVRLKVPNGQTNIHDRMRGSVTFKNVDVGDQILLKTDGFPTYHLANVVDDHLMKISHVIRGDEWLSSTPKHVLLYNAFEWNLPEFIHLPLLLNEDGSKFSKRQNHASVTHYKLEHYDPLAVINMVARLGWTPSVDDARTMDELIDEFSLDSLNHSAAVVDVRKLAWFNKQLLKRESMRASHAATLLPQLVAQYGEAATSGVDEARVCAVLAVTAGRAASMHHFVHHASKFAFVAPDLSSEVASEMATAGAWHEQVSPAALTALIARLDTIAESQWPRHDQDTALVSDAVATARDEVGASGKQMQRTLRLALTGQPVGASLVPVMCLLGKTETLRRLESAIQFFSTKQ